MTSACFVFVRSFELNKNEVNVPQILKGGWWGGAVLQQVSKNLKLHMIEM